MKSLLTIILSIITLALFSQSEKIPFFSSKNQHSISYEPIAISYDYAHRINENFGIGGRIELGAGFRYRIEDFPDITNINAVDILTLQIHYRFLLPNHFHIDAGPQLTVGTLDQFDEIIGLNYGIGLSAFYHLKKLQIGLRFHAVLYNEDQKEFDPYGNEISSKQTTNFTFLVSPFVIGIAF